MKGTRLVVCLAIFATLSAARASLAVRPADDSLPLANWVAPPYWVAPDSDARSLESKHPMIVGNPALAFHAVTPCRLADTRGPAGPNGAPNLTANAPRNFTATGVCGIPGGIAAVSFNFAVVNMSANGNLVAYPTGAPVPTVSSLNWTPPEIAISNAAVIGLGSNLITVVVNGPVGSTTDLIIDVNGYYAADPVVTSLNGTSGPINLLPSGDVTITPAGPNITIGTNAVSTNTPDTLVRRDASGNFSAGTVTATQISAGLITGTQIAASSGFLQPGTGGQALKIIRGIFQGSNGSIASGTGFTVTRTGVGIYQIGVATPFSDIPSALITPLHTAGVFVFTTLQSPGQVNLTVVSPTGVPLDPQYMNLVLVGVAP